MSIFRKSIRALIAVVAIVGLRAISAEQGDSADQSREMVAMITAACERKAALPGYVASWTNRRGGAAVTTTIHVKNGKKGREAVRLEISSKVRGVEGRNKVIQVKNNEECWQAIRGRVEKYPGALLASDEMAPPFLMVANTPISQRRFKYIRDDNVDWNSYSCIRIQAVLTDREFAGIPSRKDGAGRQQTAKTAKGAAEKSDQLAELPLRYVHLIDKETGVIVNVQTIDGTGEILYERQYDSFRPAADLDDALFAKPEATTTRASTAAGGASDQQNDNGKVK